MKGDYHEKLLMLAMSYALLVSSHGASLPEIGIECLTQTT